ncbi:MAG: IS200/IS605 family transposase [Chitinophagaceae bacterium]|nr:MAG: IS200/IS605 family transposase [Chitinophagaceae bacterium]
MANSFSQMPTHVVTAVKYRQALILPDWREYLHRYITGIFTNQGLRLLQVNSMPDHMHILFESKPNCCVSDIMRVVKAASTRWINQQKYTQAHFQWQEGNGVFNLGRKDVPVVAAYIQNQQTQHRKETFREEFLRVCREEEVDFDPQYIFHESL